MIVGHIGGGSGAAYEIAKSLRFRKTALARLVRTFGTPTNQNVFTLSMWGKRGAIDATLQWLFGTTPSSNSGILFESTELLAIYSANVAFTSTYHGRDPSAWFNLQYSLNGSAAVVSINGVVVYTATVNNVQINVSGREHYIGIMDLYSGGRYAFDGYLADVYFIDGQALGADSFGEKHPLTGQWVAKKYTGTYGNNGFFLDFKDGTNLTTLCADKSGNGNNWAASGISLTAGTTYDWMDDTPSNSFATFNPIAAASTLATLSSGSLNLFNNSNYSYTRPTTFGISAGKYYVEFKVITANGYYPRLGVVSANEPVVSMYGPGTTVGSYGVDSYAGDKSNNGTTTAYGSAIASGDTIGVALDMDTGKIWFSKNGVWFASGNPATGANPAFSGLTGTLMFAAGVYVGEVAFNAGQRPFSYTPPAGFNSLCTKNLSDPVIPNGRKHFDVMLHTGTGIARSVTGAQFSPDLVWAKARNIAYTGAIYDSVRGATKFLVPSLTDAEYTNATALTSFNADGFSTGVDSSNGINSAGITYVDWLWKAGGAPVANTVGSIASQVSANPLAGFSIVSYVGTGANATVGHGLGVQPSLVIIKARSVAPQNWVTTWKSLNFGLGYLLMNSSAAYSANSTTYQNTAPNSSVVTLGTDVGVNGSGTTYVAYCFSEVPGFSRIASYTGNGIADGPFVYCGFRPRFVMFKRADAAGSWGMYDAVRDTYNQVHFGLFPHLSSAEVDTASTPRILDFTANGFKVRGTEADQNASGGTFIFLAFAEAPFKYANAR